jgi:hypothetical protein
MREVHDELPAQQHPERYRRNDEACRDGTDRRAARAERRHGTVAGNQHDIECDIQSGHPDAEPQWRARVAGRPKRASQHEEQQHAEAEHEHRPQERQGLRFDFRRGVDEIEQRWRKEVPGRRENEQRNDNGSQKRLIDGLVNFVGLVRSGEPGNQHAHAREQRRDEDDDDKKDLPAHADRGVAGEANVVSDHRMIDDALQPTNGILQDRRPGHFPDRGRKRSLNERTIQFADTDGAGGTCRCR